MTAENPYRLPYSASERKEKDKYRLTCKRAKPYFPFSFKVSGVALSIYSSASR